MFHIGQAGGPSAIDAARELFREYEADIGVSLCFQGFERELRELPGSYAPPAGRLFLAHQDGECAGCVALRPLDEGVCEMKRLFVRPAYRGRGLGRLLVERLLDEACAIGYARMRLDTLERMRAARTLYSSLGFSPIAPYNEHGIDGTIWMERSLSPSAD
ncbi:MAG: GNAT family N-acetyltransferase [Phycisphaerae bacterium]|jgi:GNAT superfamily N-acetyltransferase